MKVVEDAMSLPLVSSAYTEVTRLTSPYMESTKTKVNPVVEMVSPMVDSVKTRGEEQLMTQARSPPASQRLSRVSRSMPMRSLPSKR